MVTSWLSEGLRSQAAMTEPSFLPAPVLAVLLFPWPKSEPSRRRTESRMRSLPDPALGYLWRGIVKWFAKSV